MAEKQVTKPTTASFAGDNLIQVGYNYGPITVQRQSLPGEFSENQADPR